MLVPYIVVGLATVVAVVVIVRVSIRRHRDPDADNWSEDQKSNVTGNMWGITRR